MSNDLKLGLNIAAAIIFLIILLLGVIMDKSVIYLVLTSLIILVYCNGAYRAYNKVQSVGKIVLVEIGICVVASAYYLYDIISMFF